MVWIPANENSACCGKDIKEGVGYGIYIVKSLAEMLEWGFCPQGYPDFMVINTPDYKQQILIKQPC